MTESEHKQRQLRAAQLMGQGKVAAARDMLIAMVSQYPGDWLSRVQLAELAESEGDLGRALGLIQEALSIAPTNLKLTAKLALVAQQAGDFGLARSNYTQAIQADPQAYQDLSVNLGHCCYALGDFAAAVGYYQQYLARLPQHIQCRTNLALALEKLFQFDDAAGQWDELQALEPENPRWPTLKGVLELKRENLSGAQLALRRAAELGADDEVFHINRASLQFEQGHYKRSLAILHQRPELAARPDVQQLKFLNRFQAGLYGQCVEQVEEIVAAGHRQAAMVALSLLPQVHLEMNNPDAARQAQNFAGLIERQRISMDLTIAAELEQQIVTHPSLTFEPVTTSTHNGSQTESLLVPGSEAVQQLLAGIRERVISYAQYVRSTAGPYASLIPDSGRIKIWAVALSSGGYQGSHMHPHGIISGVFYLQVPAGDNLDQGALELGCPELKFSVSQPPLRSVQRVTSGDLLIFPSWCFHRTLPFESSQQRISIAFDVVPPDSPEWNDPGLSPPFSLIE